MTKPNSSLQGFSFVELAIVIIIIALLMAGVLVGQNLIKSAELQQIASNFSYYRDAVKSFQDKYKYLPGDFPNAESYWGTRVCSDTASSDTSTATCNGNGDGFITGSTGTPLALGTNYHEALLVWQHLSNAQLVKGTYNGRPGMLVTWWKPGTNMPQGQNEIAGYNMSYAGIGSATGVIAYAVLGNADKGNFSAKYHHIITYGSTFEAAKNETPTRMLLSPSDAGTVDRKIDDGKPGLGNILSEATSFDSGTTYECVTSSSPKAAAYLNSTTANKCALYFITGM